MTGLARNLSDNVSDSSPRWGTSHDSRLVVSNMASRQPGNAAAVSQICHIDFGSSSQLCVGKPVCVVCSGDLGWRLDRQLNHLGPRFVHSPEVYVLLLLVYGGGCVFPAPVKRRILRD